MRTLSSALLFLFLLGLSSCSLINDLIPDVDTTYSKTFSINVTAASGETSPQLIDVTSSEDYDDFKDNIEGFEITDVKYQISEYNAPSDLYFEGEIQAEDQAMSMMVTAGTISRVMLSGVADDGMEHDVSDVAQGLDKMVDWLDSPGKFYASASYSLTDGPGEPYDVEGKGYSFKLKVIYYVTVKTGS